MEGVAGMLDQISSLGRSETKLQWMDEFICAKSSVNSLRTALSLSSHSSMRITETTEDANRVL